MVANIQVITSMGLTGKDVNLNMLSLFHIKGLNLALAVMQVGGRNVIIEKFKKTGARTHYIPAGNTLGEFSSYTYANHRRISEG